MVSLHVLPQYNLKLTVSIGTMFIALTDTDQVYSPFNLSAVNPHVVAGPFLYQSG